MAEPDRWPRIDGRVAATLTPFQSDGSLFLGSIEKYAELLSRSGLAGVFIAGTTGESHSITVDERMALAERWRDVTRGSSLKLIVHVGGNCQVECIALADHARRIGADGCAALAPSYFRPETVADLCEFLRPIAKAGAGLPFYFYDIPILTNVRMSMVELMEQLPTVTTNFAGIKYTNNDLIQLQSCLAVAGGLEFMWGIDEIALSAWTLGIDGAVGSTYNAINPLFQQMRTAFDRVDLPTARTLQTQVVRFVQELAAYGYLGALKAVMTSLGVACGPVRSPLRRFATQDIDTLRNKLDTAGLTGCLADAV